MGEVGISSTELLPPTPLMRSLRIAGEFVAEEIVSPDGAIGSVDETLIDLDFLVVFHLFMKFGLLARS